jgi:4-carboxymuconolactone decarboxylase
MSALRVTLEAARAALQDAGLTAAAIDGVLTRNLDMDVTYMHSQMVAKHLGLKPRFTTDINLGGATAIAMLEQAAILITTGVCRLVLCAYGENRRTSWAVERHGRIKMGHEDFEECYGLTWGMGPHALAAQRHMHMFGTTSRQLGMIAVAQRHYASRNPHADLRTPLSLEEYERSPLLIAPLRKYDLAYLFDGGAAFVVADLSWARQHTACPVPIMGLGQAHSGEHSGYCANMVTVTTTPAIAPLSAHFRGPYSLSEREREIAVCVILSKWHSAYPTNAHERAAKAAGLPNDKVEAILSGLTTSFSDKREQVVYEVATCLANSRWVGKGLYDRAVEALGHVGITDVITLMGFYTSVSMTLAFYDVPAGAPGMER